jgi:hypothetical protein
MGELTSTYGTRGPTRSLLQGGTERRPLGPSEPDHVPACRLPGLLRQPQPSCCAASAPSSAMQGGSSARGCETRVGVAGTSICRRRAILASLGARGVHKLGPPACEVLPATRCACEADGRVCAAVRSDGREARRGESLGNPRSHRRMGRAGARGVAPGERPGGGRRVNPRARQQGGTKTRSAKRVRRAGVRAGGDRRLCCRLSRSVHLSSALSR